MKLPVRASTGRPGPGHHHPAQPPAGHPEILGEGVEHHAGRGEVCQADRPTGVAVDDAVVDLVADHRSRARRTTRDGGQFVGRSIVPVGLAGQAITSPSRRARASGSSSAAVGWKRVSGPQSISTTRSPAPQHVAVGGVARPRQRHPVAGLERGQEHQQEPAGGAMVITTSSSGDVDARRTPWCAAIASRNSGTPGGDLCSRGPPRRAAAWPPTRTAGRAHGRGLADHEVDQVAVGEPRAGSPPPASPHVEGRRVRLRARPAVARSPRSRVDPNLAVLASRWSSQRASAVGSPRCSRRAHPARSAPRVPTLLDLLSGQELASSAAELGHVGAVRRPVPAEGGRGRGDRARGVLGDATTRCRSVRRTPPR